MSGTARAAAGPIVRPPAVAGMFYPADAGRLRALVSELIAMADAGAAREGTPGGTASAGYDGEVTGVAPRGARLVGILVPHAGLVYSGAVAAAAWRRLAREATDGSAVAPSHAETAATPRTVVILGTNHGAGWLDGIGVWDGDAWRTPLGDVTIDAEVAAAIAGLGGPFVVDRLAHRAEHSIEVQLPFLAHLARATRIVPLAVSAGTGEDAVAAGARLGRLLAEHVAGSATQAAGGPRRILVAISSDMAHYPAARDADAVTAELLPPMLGIEPEELARREEAVTRRGVRGLVCGMCGIQPTVFGLATLRSLGATRGIALAAATSADAGGPDDRTVGYLSAAFVAD